ncbi:MAG: hypothetical protein N4A49_14745 [Marinifilaceae bacterium]|jgi:hypothetical protein|nr:hypothetical protein [Marinifilaceae bacterium]
MSDKTNMRKEFVDLRKLLISRRYEDAAKHIVGMGTSPSGAKFNSEEDQKAVADAHITLENLTKYKEYESEKIRELLFAIDHYLDRV